MHHRLCMQRLLFVYKNVLDSNKEMSGAAAGHGREAKTEKEFEHLLMKMILAKMFSFVLSKQTELHVDVCVCLLLQDLLQSCAHGGGG